MSPFTTPLLAGTCLGIPSHLKALFRNASGQQYGLNYSHVGKQFVEIVSDLSPDDFDEEASWEDLLATELGPILNAIASESVAAPERISQFKAWVRLRFPGIAEKVPVNRWGMFTRGAVQGYAEVNW